ncbi:MAG TPA: VOC family protein [Hyphomicrobiales bacterium]|nr:VOC family protein [Hyphomicrobiales bacterium]
MSILGVESLVYGVDDLDTAARFFTDFGLVAETRAADGHVFRLPEGSSIVLRRADDPALPAPFLAGNGPREVIWGVDSSAALEAIRADLVRDRDVAVDAGGTLHTRDDQGIAIGFRVFRRQMPEFAPSVENNPADVKRWNRHRNWYDEARPKIIIHVVFGIPEIDKGIDFYTERLGFRTSDVMKGVGKFLRCDGRADHHNLFFIKTPRLIFSHVAFGVDNIDELMAGADDMQRRGWASEQGLGRHRISSYLFYYMKCPAGGQAEYSADGDYLTDDWQPRLWSNAYGHIHWLAQLPDAAARAPRDMTVIEGRIPSVAETAESR